MSTDPNANRPLSPFMLGSLYKWQISSITSTIHRITGIALFFSFAILCLWVVGAFVGGGWFSFANFFVGSWIGRLIMLLSLWGMWYHFLNGIRHLAWDFGKGLELERAAQTGKAVIVGSIVMTVITLILV